MWPSTGSTQQHNPPIRPGGWPHSTSLHRATAAKMRGNITIRQAPTYTSQAQGSAEGFHRTLMGQVRTLKSQLQNNYDIRLTSKHPIVAWMARHTAYLLNRYAIHSDGSTSFFRRWHKEHKTPLCEFGETVLPMLPNPPVTGGPYISRPPPVYKPLRRSAAAESDTQTFESGETTQQRATTQPPQFRAQQSALLAWNLLASSCSLLSYCTSLVKGPSIKTPCHWRTGRAHTAKHCCLNWLEKFKALLW